MRIYQSMWDTELKFVKLVSLSKKNHMNHTCKNGHFSKKLLADLIYSVLTLIKLAHLKKEFFYLISLKFVCI